MAGGIFADQPFYPNFKCIIIGIILMVLYWVLPYRNPFMLPIIFLVGYIAIAWYDYLYNCEAQMYSGTFPVGSATLDAWAKPQRRFEKHNNQDITNLVEKQELVYKKKIYAMHALFIAPLLYYLGWYGKNANKNIWSVVGTVGFLVVLYHGLRLIYPREVTSCVEENKEERRNLLVISWLHLLAVAPLLLYVAYNGSKSDQRVWGSLLGLSIIVFLYHGFRFFYPREIKENCPIS